MAAEKRALLDLPVDKRAGAGAGAAGRECDKEYESHGMRNGHEVQSDDVWLQRVADQTRRRARDVWTCGRVDVWTCGRVDVWTCGRVESRPEASGRGARRDMDLAEAVEAQRELRLECREEGRVITGVLAESGRARDRGGLRSSRRRWWWWWWQQWWWCCCKRVVEVEVEEEEEGDASEALGSPGIRDVETQPKLAAIGREQCMEKRPTGDGLSQMWQPYVLSYPTPTTRRQSNKMRTG
ncbi:hypothetical protein E4U52_005667 [Claviceps spartinae]|nr:hypothetical protein E4U52_005667 [Claviceps spartinae]